MKLSEWARRQGIAYKTAWLWYKRGQLPVEVVQMPSGTLLVREPPAGESRVVLYARVSSGDQKGDLDAQVGRLSAFAAERGMHVAKVVREVGSGLNGGRPKLLCVLSDKSLSAVVVEHRDRLMRFGAEYVEAALKADGRQLIVMNPGEVPDDLAQDMIDVLTSMCARLYGKRSAKQRALRAVRAAEGARGT